MRLRGSRRTVDVIHPVGIECLAQRYHLYWIGDILAEEGALHAEAVRGRVEEREGVNVNATPLAGRFDGY